ncbi:uncharacterized protein LOC111633964 [Centruroides sculpturatus]|uniref:uncharacterized protein LOC111633964 n=1 Tax=Centruroides sculpturatus TaxID=218467 RepID=UPI000C6D9B43|nr:uncharacterized protein LOC111633964 [Centruroides sculpturatus]
MEAESNLNRAGDKDTRQYKGNAVAEEELKPLFNSTANPNEGKPVERIAASEINSQQDSPRLLLRRNDGNLALSIRAHSPNSSPVQRRHKNPEAKEDEISNNRIDNVSINLSDSQILFNHEQPSSPSKSPSPERPNLRPRRNMSDVTIELSSIKSNTPVPSLNEGKDDDEQILETLRVVIRKCTNPEASKRPTSDEIGNLFNSFLK